MKTKKFHLGDVLSITTGYLVSPRHMDGVYDILNFMTGDNLFTHQLPRAGDECKPYLIDQFTQLTGNEKVVADWLAKQVAKHGEMFAVKSIPTNAHEVKNPIAEVAEMMGGPVDVIVVQTD